MAITTGVQAASATPATDAMAFINTALLAAGWVEEVTRTYTASIMGTTANCRVYTSSATTVASGIYTGTVLSFEVDDTNTRIRFRVCEKFDSTLSGASALNTKWAAPGNISSAAQTPTANYAITDSFVTHFQTQGNAASVGWVNIDCSAQGFAYMLGARAEQFLYANNSGGLHHWVYMGQLTYTMLSESGGSPCVFLACKATAANTDCSWTVAASTSAGNVRTSKEPLTTTSTTGPFCFLTGTSSTLTWVANKQGTASKFYTGVAMWPVFLHGVAGGGIVGARMFLAAFTGFVLLNPGNAQTTDMAMGDTLTVGATTYYAIGQTHVSETQIVEAIIAVDGSIF